MAEYLLLKWGTLKGWTLETDKSLDAFEKYAELGMSLDTMTQPNSLAHKEALCELIDAIDGKIQNDWTGEIMTKEQAKQYIMEYRN